MKVLFYSEKCKYSSELIKKLKMYNLRREVSIEKTNYNVLVTTKDENSTYTLIDKRFFNVDLRRVYVKNLSKNNEVNDNENIIFFDKLINFFLVLDLFLIK